MSAERKIGGCVVCGPPTGSTEWTLYRNNGTWRFASFETTAAVVQKIQVFWDVMPCVPSFAFEMSVTIYQSKRRNIPRSEFCI
jgi:hypothetical protein